MNKLFMSQLLELWFKFLDSTEYSKKERTLENFMDWVYENNI